MCCILCGLVFVQFAAYKISRKPIHYGKKNEENILPILLSSIGWGIFDDIPSHVSSIPEEYAGRTDSLIDAEYRSIRDAKLLRHGFAILVVWHSADSPTNFIGSGNRHSPAAPCRCGSGWALCFAPRITASARSRSLLVQFRTCTFHVAKPTGFDSIRM